MAAETQYTANTAMQVINLHDSSLDGAGAVTILTGAALGTMIKTVTIKAIANTTHGMIRLYDYDGTDTKIIYEVEVPAVTKSGSDPTFEMVIPINYALKSGCILKATTEQGNDGHGGPDDFIVIAEGLDWTYYTPMVRPESTNYTANTGMQTISTANSNLNGTGTLSSAIITGASNGTTIKSIVIKAQVTTSLGMVRLFLYDGTNTRLFKEVSIPEVAKSAISSSFTHTIDFEGKGFALKSGWSLKASTEIGQAFNVIAEGLDWTYPS